MLKEGVSHLNPSKKDLDMNLSNLMENPGLVQKPSLVGGFQLVVQAPKGSGKAARGNLNDFKH